jgi:hypothetical protein
MDCSAIGHRAFFDFGLRISDCGLRRGVRLRSISQLVEIVKIVEVVEGKWQTVNGER